MATKAIKPTEEQKSALQKLWDFLDDEELKVFILRGYAGTGKTTLMKLFIERLSEDGRSFCLLASTGRAAKVISAITNCPASTIHSKIYNFNGLNQEIDELINAEKKEKTLKLEFSLFTSIDREIYIVDEASMISEETDEVNSTTKFGSGNLLADLFNSNPNAKFIFVGDECQLPPIKRTFSPALDKDYLEENYSIKADEFGLEVVVRQRGNNDIPIAASHIRQMYYNPPIKEWGKFHLNSYSDIKILPSTTNMLTRYIQSVKKGGYSSATLITQSNKSCTELAELLRPSFGFTSPRLQVGELLLVTRNNILTGLMNGDFVIVTQIGASKQRAGLSFLNVEVEELYSHRKYSQLLIENVLYSRYSLSLSQNQFRNLYIDCIERFQQIKREECERLNKKLDTKSKEYKDALKDAMYHDQYINALVAVYGYAITCHKAQGGEWNSVYLDIKRFFAHNPSSQTYQWLYTAITRAKEELYLVKDFYIE